MDRSRGEEGERKLTEQDSLSQVFTEEQYLHSSQEVPTPNQDDQKYTEPPVRFQADDIQIKNEVAVGNSATNFCLIC